MWLASVAWRARAVDARDDALALVQRAALQDDVERLVVADAEHVVHARQAVAVGAFDRADVGDLPAARRVEGRLGELDQVALAVAVLREGPDRADGRRLLLGLIAGEARLEAAFAREHAGDLAGRADAAALAGAPARATALALLLHQLLEVAFDLQALLGEQLARHLVREAVGVVQAEDVLRGDRLHLLRARRLDQLAQRRHALLERAPEALLLGRQPHVGRPRPARAARGRRRPSARARALRSA